MNNTKGQTKEPTENIVGQTLGEALARLESGTRVYVSGQITDNAGWRTEFESARDYLERFDLVGVLPTENGLPFEESWGNHLKADLAVIDGCDAVLMLQNWNLSRGARIEHEYSIGTRKVIFYQSKVDGDLILADKIISTVCRVSGITVDQLRSETRTQRLANARLVVIGLTLRLTELRHSQIAALIHRDHSTVTTRRDSFSDLYRFNKEFRRLVDSVVGEIAELQNLKIV